MRKSTIGGSLVLACAGAVVAAGCSHGVTAVPVPPTALEGTASSGGFSGGPQPSFPATVSATTPPPPISGGTLLVTQDGKMAIAADPDRDAIYGVDLTAVPLAVRFTVALKPGDEPGRLIEDGAGHIHVALRGSGAVVTIDPAKHTVIDRQSVCPAPRGLAWDSSTDTVTVACATGELVTLPAVGGAPTRSLHLERDLRDVVVQNGALSVSSFRSAQILRLAADLSVTRRDPLPSPDSQRVPHIAWRTVAGPSGSVVAVHQAESTQSLSTTTPGGYGGNGGAVVNGVPLPNGPVDDDAGPLLLTGDPVFGTDAGAPMTGDASLLPTFFSATPESGAVVSILTVMGADGTVYTNRAFNGVLPVDVAVSLDGTQIAIATPGGAFTPNLANLVLINGTGAGAERDLVIDGGQQLTAVAFDGNGDVLGLTREPAQLLLLNSGVVTTSVSLSTTSREDTGHDVFHTQAGALIACASCHPEGGDDGHVWLLDGNRRRTPSLRGTIAGTAPYHWPGDESDLPTLVNDVYIVRMGGAQLLEDQMTSLTSWVQTIPAPPAPSWVDPAAATLGQAIFERADTACTTCHTGAKFTNNATVDVGTGGAFQVPPLVGVGWRTPLMHDGCAQTIADRFAGCATVPHGNISMLSAADIGNLSTYLETL
jgi:cytochrome c553